MTRIDELDRVPFLKGQRATVLRVMTWWLDNTSPCTKIRQQFLDWLKAEFGVRAKRCVRCSQWKPESAFNRSAHNRDGRLGACKDCIRAYKLAHYHKIAQTAEYKAKRSAKGKRAWARLKQDPEKYAQWLEDRRQYRIERAKQKMSTQQRGEKAA